MDTVYPQCAGLDVHKKTVVACRITRDANDHKQQQTQTFSPMTADLLRLSDWLQEAGVTHVAMESTGEYWMPVYNILEGTFTLLLVNAQHIKSVPGRKTDVKDAEWIAELLQHGLLRSSFVPPAPQRVLRELTRHRSNFIRERINLVNRVQKVLEGANIKLGSVAADILGLSARAMLDALVAGQTDAASLAELSRGKMRRKRELLAQALEGRLLPHQRFVLAELLCQIDSLDETLARFDAEIEQACAPFAEAVAHLDTIPGVAQTIAQVIVSEIGTDMSRFPTPHHLAAWAGVAPGNCESGGKRLCGRHRAGNRLRRSALVQAAHAAAHTKETALAAQYHRLAARRGYKRAILAVAHSILVIAYRLIERKEDYQDLGANYFEECRPDAVAKRLVGRLEKLGYQVSLHKPAPAASIP